MLEGLSNKVNRLKTEFTLCKDSQGRVLTADERMLTLTHIVQQEFIIYGRSTPNLASLGKIIDFSVPEDERLKILGPGLRRSILMSVSTHDLVLSTSPQGVGIPDDIKQQRINRISAIASGVEEGINYSGKVRLPFYDLRDAFFARCGNFIVGFGIRQAHNLHTQVLTQLNSIKYLMRIRLKGAYEELDDHFRMSRLITKLNIYRNEPDGFSQANQADMVEMLFRFYQGLAFAD